MPVHQINYQFCHKTFSLGQPNNHIHIPIEALLMGDSLSVEMNVMQIVYLIGFNWEKKKNHTHNILISFFFYSCTINLKSWVHFLFFLSLEYDAVICCVRIPLCTMFDEIVAPKMGRCRKWFIFHFVLATVFSSSRFSTQIESSLFFWVEFDWKKAK